jgi:Protein of unknown function (DUF3987)
VGKRLHRRDQRGERPDRSLPSQSYPIEALGDVLGNATGAIALKIQCPESMAAQSVLGVASLAVQALVDVAMPYGQTRPASLFLLSISESGDRKTTSDIEAMIPVRMREKALRDQYAVLNEIYNIDSKAWQAQSDQIRRSKTEIGERRRKLEELGPAPLPPLQPFLRIDEGTAEGLFKLMPGYPGALGIFSAEGGQFLNGHGFTPEAKNRSAAGFSTLWDGRELRSARAGDGLRACPGRRLACHLMVQPDAARDVLTDPVLRNQGFLSRFLIVAPDSLAGSRMWREPPESLEPALRRYSSSLLRVFEVPPITLNGAGNELAPRSLPMSPEARALWISSYNSIERDTAAGSRLDQHRDVAAKSAEPAARIAAVLTIVDDPYAKSIPADAMTRACRLANWYLDESLRLAELYLVPQEAADAQKLLAWLHARGIRQISAATLHSRGPGPLRVKERLDPAITELEAAGSLMADPDATGKARAWRVAPMAAQ